MTRLSVTPVKGLGLHHPDQVDLGPGGAAGDRDFFCIDERGALLSITRSGAWVALRAAWDPAAGRLALHHDDGRAWEDEVVAGERVVTDFFGLRDVPGRVVEGPWAAVLSEAAGEPVRLVRADMPGGGSDVEPVTLLGDASVRRLAQLAGAPVDPRRFRMLIGFDGAHAHAEDGWRGRRLAVGDAVLEVGGRVPRCAATTRHPDRGDRDLPVVRLLRDLHGVDPEAGGVPFGVYAGVVRPGRVRVGDQLRAAAGGR